MINGSRLYRAHLAGKKDAVCLGKTFLQSNSCSTYMVTMCNFTFCFLIPRGRRRGTGKDWMDGCKRVFINSRVPLWHASYPGVPGYTRVHTRSHPVPGIPGYGRVPTRSYPDTYSATPGTRVWPGTFSFISGYILGHTRVHTRSYPGTYSVIPGYLLGHTRVPTRSYPGS